MHLPTAFGAREGDVRWSDDTAYAGGARVRLFKLHGSIDWYSFQFEGRVRTGIFLRAAIWRRPGTEQERKLVAQTGKPSFLSGINKSDAYQRGIYTRHSFSFLRAAARMQPHFDVRIRLGDTAMNFRLDSWFDRSRANRMILLQEHPGELVNRSLVFATGYKAWD